MFGNIKSCLKLLPLPFALPLQLSFRLPPHFKLPVPRAFLYPFLHIFETVFCNNSCNFTKQLWRRTFKHLAYLSSSEKVLFTVDCLFCVSVQRIVILLNLAVISVFDCFVRVCKGCSKQINYQIQLFIPVGSLGILASFFSPFLEILNTWHEFFPLGDFFKHIDVLFGFWSPHGG